MTAIEDYLNSLPYYFYFLVVDDFLDIKLPRLNHFTSISPNSLGIQLEQKNSGRLLSHTSCQSFIKNNTPPGITPAIIPFKPSPKIELICQQQGWLNVSNPSRLNRLLEDKIQFAKLLDKHSLPHIPHLITTFNEANYVLACDQLQTNTLVVQTHFGWAGNSSHLTSRFSDLSSKIAPNTPVKITPFFKDGKSLINNCCLTKFGVIQSPPGLQYTGIPQLSPNPLATTGRQWPSHTSKTVNEQIWHITNQFSQLLESLEYRGFFGLDFFVSKDRVYLLECNPRLTASFAFYTTIENATNYQPLFFHHLLSFIDHQFNFDISFESKRFYDSSMVGSELTLKNPQGGTLRKFHDFIDMAPEGDPTKISERHLDQVLHEIQ